VTTQVDASLNGGTRTAGARLLGIQLDGLTNEQVLDRIRDGMRAGTGGWVVTANLDILRQAAGDRSASELISEADIVVADGTPVVWASKLQGTPVPERVAGSDLTWTSSQVAAEESVPVFLLGGNVGAAEGAAAQLVRQYPSLRVVGTACPEHGFEQDPRRMKELVDAVCDSDARLVLVGLGFPKQERMIRELRRLHPAAWYVGVGISFSFVTGELRRAPRWMQRAGLEWVHRMVQEPRRLTHRYVWQDLPFAARLLAVALRCRVAGRRSS